MNNHLTFNAKLPRFITELKLKKKVQHFCSLLYYQKANSVNTIPVRNKILIIDCEMWLDPEVTKSTTETFTAFSLGIYLLKHFPLDAVAYFSIHSEDLFFLGMSMMPWGFSCSTVKLIKLPRLMHSLQMRHLYHFDGWLVVASLPTECNAPAWSTKQESTDSQ